MNSSRGFSVSDQGGHEGISWEKPHAANPQNPPVDAYGRPLTGLPPTNQFPNYPPSPPYGQQYPNQPQQPYGQPNPYAAQPQWGQQPQWGPQGYGSVNRATNGMAIASMVLGILWIWWIGSILALIFGYVAKSQIKARNESGDGMATAGLVLGWIGVGFFLLFVVIGIARS
jgi:hypothetical protein